MSVSRDNSNFNNRLKKNIMPITITTNNNPNNYVFVNKKNQIASLYLKMGQKMQSKKLKNMKSNLNIQNSYDSSNINNNLSNNSLQLCNFSMLNNLKTNDNISGFATNRAQNNENTIPNKQDYIIHVNLNHNHISSSNFSLNNNNQSRPLNKNENREDLNQNRDSDENNLGILSREDFQKLDEDDPFIHEDQNGDRIGNFYEDMDMSIVEVNNSLRSYQLSENQPPELLIFVKKISKTEITREFTKKK